MDQVYVLRHKVLVEGLSVRDVARQLGISRNTARRYLEGAAPRVRAPTHRPKPVVDRIRPKVEALLTDAPRWTGGKQRLTAARVHRLLLEDGLQASETVVKDLVREWKRQRQEVFVPLVYRPGDLGEVDFFEVLVDSAGQRQKAWMFLMRLMHSGRDFAWLYPRQDQICFLDGHVRAFAHFGAVPQRLVYDNLKSAVTRVLVGSERELSPRFAAMATHYVFESCFARPATGHDKGGVESRGKAIRWQHLVPIPTGHNLESVSGQLVAKLDARASEQRDSEGRSVMDRFDDERCRMLPLAQHPFRAAALRLPSVSRRALVKLEGALYSVPCRWACLDVTAYIGVDEVEIVGPTGSVHHPRVRFGARSIDYRHYVPELARKPQAVRQVADELVRDLGEPFGRVWRTLVDQHGPKHAARIFAQVLRCLEQQGHASVVERLERALRDNEPLPLALQSAASPASDVSRVLLPSSLQNIEVLAGRASDYDALLGGAS